MKIYNYDADTGKYLSEGEADESPLEPGVFLIPAHATDIEPPQQDGHEAYFVDGVWQLVEIPVPPVPTQEELIFKASEAVRRALQSAIDAKARDLGFSSGDSVIQYAGWPNSYQDMAIAFGTWEVSVWVEAGAYKAQVLLGNELMLTPEEAVARMPELEMPA